MLRIIRVRDTKGYIVYKIVGEGVAPFQKPLYLTRNTRHARHKGFDCVPIEGPIEEEIVVEEDIKCLK